MSPASETAAKSGRKYSERLGVLHDRQFQTALERFKLGKFVKAESVSGGLFGQNVFVTSSQGEFVLRGCPHFDWQFTKERFIAGFLHERTDVPAPWPYLIDEKVDIFGWSYVLMPRMPGDVPVDDWYDRLSAEDRVAISFAMGECMARLQAPEGPCTGEYDFRCDKVVPFEHGWADCVAVNVRKGTESSRKHTDLLTAADAAWVDAAIEKAMPWLQGPFKPTFVMQDFKRGNLTVQREGDRWRVSGLFDLMEPYFGDGEIDLWRHLADDTAAGAVAFLKGYHSRVAFRPGYAERMMVYMLADRIGIWSYGVQPHVSWFKTMPFKDWIEKYVRRVQLAIETVKRHS